MWLLAIPATAQKSDSGEMSDSLLYSAHSSATVGIRVLGRSPELDINKALYGRLAGLNVYQGSGRPGDNYAELSFHGHAPLILVDGFPRDLNSVTMPEIESVTVLKDAAALALYGVRGANGVVNITTKRGKESPLKISASYQFGLNTQFRAPEFADAFTYASALNQALKLDGLAEKYSTKELDVFKSGKYPYAYPDVDWWKEAYRETGTNHQLGLTFTGGNEKFKYYTVASYSYDRAMFKHDDEDERYSTKPFDVRLNLRTNLDLKLTKTTLMQVGLMGRMQEINGPKNLQAIYSAVYNTPAAAFPIRTEDGTFGGNNIYGSANPVAMLGSSGHYKYVYTTLYADLKIRQELSELVKGLYAEAGISFDNQGGLWENSTRTYRYCDLQPSMMEDGTVVTNPVYYGTNSATVGHNDGFNRLYLRTDLKFRLGYERELKGHYVAGAVIYEQQGDVNDGRNSTFKRQSVMVDLGYSYLNRYFLNAAFSYSGTNVLPDGDRFKAYPAVSAAWVVSNEDFLKSSPVIQFMKLKASYGLTGWDGNTPHELFYQSYGYASDYVFGNKKTVSGWSEGRLPVENLTVEKSERATVGLDLRMFKNHLNFSAEGFYERRSDILVDASNSVAGVIGIGVAQLNAGINDYKGIDLSLGWEDRIGDFGYGISGTFSFVRTKIKENNEAYQPYDYLYTKGNRINQAYGLEAIGFFNDQIDINNSPVHTFTTVRPGDVKYKDQNGDNKIDAQDRVKMYQPLIPEIYYGFNLDFSYKHFSVSANFQGVANYTVNLLSSPLYQPLLANSTISKTFLDRETTWTPENQAKATMPRLTTSAVDNNYKNSSLWYRNGAFLKLRHLQFAYEVPKTATKFADLTVYLRGMNLFSADKIKFADPEQLFVSYPSVRSYWVGVKFNF